MLFDPYYMQENLNQHVYVHILEIVLLLFRNTWEPHPHIKLFWSQDCCSAHSTALIRQFLDHTFAERLFDITPSDLFFGRPKTEGLFEWSTLCSSTSSRSIARENKEAINDLNELYTISIVKYEFLIRLGKFVELGVLLVEM